MTLLNIIKEDTNDGRNIISFLTNAMNGRLDGFKPYHRLSAARLLIIYGNDDTPLDTREDREHPSVSTNYAGNSALFPVALPTIPKPDT